MLLFFLIQIRLSEFSEIFHNRNGNRDSSTYKGCDLPAKKYHIRNENTSTDSYSSNKPDYLKNTPHKAGNRFFTTGRIKGQFCVFGLDKDSTNMIEYCDNSICFESGKSSGMAINN